MIIFFTNNYKVDKDNLVIGADTVVVSILINFFS